MKKAILLALAVILLASLLTGCGPKETASVGPALLTVGGKIGAKNSADTYVLDQAYFESRSVEITLDDPWIGDGITYRGILVRDLAKDLNVTRDAKILRVISSDGLALNIFLPDAQKWDIMLARWANGTELDADSGGPIKVVFPAGARNAYGDKFWMWWLTSAEVQ